MKLSDFKIGRVFYMGHRKWLCTDVGTRTVAAICLSEVTVVRNGKSRLLSEPEAKEWISGPPYAVAEQCLDEDDVVACSPRLSEPAGLQKNARARHLRPEAVV